MWLPVCPLVGVNGVPSSTAGPGPWELVSAMPAPYGHPEGSANGSTSIIGGSCDWTSAVASATTSTLLEAGDGGEAELDRRGGSDDAQVDVGVEVDLPVGVVAVRQTRPRHRGLPGDEIVRRVEVAHHFVDDRVLVARGAGQELRSAEGRQVDLGLGVLLARPGVAEVDGQGGHGQEEDGQHGGEDGDGAVLTLPGAAHVHTSGCVGTFSTRESAACATIPSSMNGTSGKSMS